MYISELKIFRDNKKTPTIERSFSSNKKEIILEKCSNFFETLTEEIDKNKSVKITIEVEKIK